MADSLDMAGLAFGARRGTRIAGRALRGLRGARVRRPRVAGRRRRRVTRRFAARGGGARGVRLSNDFIKAILLMSIARGLQA